MELSLNDLKDLVGSKNETIAPKRHPFCIGKDYLIRTVTMTLTGKLIDVFETELVLENAAWIADTGRFSKSLVSCEFEEVEIFPVDKTVVVGRGALIDAVIIDKLPTETK